MGVECLPSPLSDYLGGGLWAETAEELCVFRSFLLSLGIAVLLCLCPGAWM